MISVSLSNSRASAGGGTALRACGTRRGTVVTRDGRFGGQNDEGRLSDDAIVVLLVASGRANDCLIVALDATEEIVER